MLQRTLPDAYCNDGLLTFDCLSPDGLACMGLRIDPPDLQNGSAALRNASQDVHRQLLKSLAEGQRMQVRWQVLADYHDVFPAYQRVTDACTDPATREIRNGHLRRHLDRMRRGLLRRERVTLFLGRKIPGGGSNGSGEAGYQEQLRLAQSEFAEHLQTLRMILAAQGGRVTTLSDDELFREWFCRLNPSSCEAMQLLPRFDPGQSLLEQCWHSELRGLGAQGFFLDGCYFGVLTLKQWPLETHPTIIHRLTHLPIGDYDISVLIERLSTKALIDREQSELDRLHQLLMRKPDERVASTAAQKGERLRRLSEGRVIPLRMEFIIVARAATPEALTGKLFVLKNAINGMNGARYLEATCAATARNLFAKTLPGNLWSDHPGVQLYAEDNYGADLLPISTTFTGQLRKAEALYSGNRGNLVGVATFLGEGAAATPQNLVVIGSAGMGKSLLVSDLLEQIFPYFGTTIIIEEGGSHAPFCRRHGGQPIEFRLDGRQTINVLDTRGLARGAQFIAAASAALARMVGLPADQDRAGQRVAVITKYLTRLGDEHADDHLRSMSEAARRDLVREALAIQAWGQQRGLSFWEAALELRAGCPLHSIGQAAALQPVDEAAIDAAYSAPIVRDLLFATLRPEEQPTLSSFREFLEVNGEGPELEECQRLATLLARWCQGGSFGNLWDGPSTVQCSGRVVQYDLAYLAESAAEARALAGFVSLNQARLDVLTLPREVRKCLVLEEVSRLIDVPGGEQQLREAYEQFRKYNVLVISIWQQYSRLADTAVRAAVIGNSRAFFIFNPGDRADVERLAADIGLSAVAVETILRYPRPDQQTGPQKYSECCYIHTAPCELICGTLRFERLPEPMPSN